MSVTENALTGELKIVRMSYTASPPGGGQEIFMFVEKVMKSEYCALINNRKSI